MYIHSVGDFRQQVIDDVANLKDDVKESCGKHVRRIDRFIQLSMIGSHRCVKNHTLAADCDLYLASADASKSNTINALHQVFVEKQPLMPLNFVNLVSNAAVFYVAQSLEINGTSLFISSENSPLEKALALAALDLADGSGKQALVGVVDECCTPVCSQRHLYGADDNAVTGESSIWFLASSDVNGAIAKITANRTVFGIDALLAHLATLSDKSSVIAAGRSLQQDVLAALANVPARLWHYSQNIPLQNGVSAYAVADFLQSLSDESRLIHLECNETGLIQLLVVDKLA